MKKSRARLALVALALPLLVPTAASADPYLNNCTVPANSVITSFTATCSGANGPNVDSGVYTFNFTWPVNPCLTAGGPVAGSVTGNGPWGPFNQGAALALINASNLHDLNFGFFRQSGGSATGRHSAMFRFTCIAGTGFVQPNGQVSQIEAIYSAGSMPNSSYCAYGGINGTATYNAPGAGWSGQTGLTMALTIVCTGIGASAGTYTITSSGIETGGCNSGVGTGTITGTGPGGQAVSGAWTYGRSTVHYFGFPPNGTGFIRMGERVYGFYLWLDVIANPTGGPMPCPLPGGAIVGHGLVIA